MKKFIGLIIATVLIILSIVILNGIGIYFGSFVGVLIGLVTTIVINGISTKRYLMAVIGSVTVAIMGIIVLIFFATIGYFVLVDIYDRFATEHTLDLHLHGSYAVDTSGIREYANVKEDVPFTYFVQLVAGNNCWSSHNRNSFLEMYGFELPDELMNDIAFSDDNIYLLISFGRKLREVKYKYMGTFSDGVNSRAKVTFYMDHHGDMIYVYFIDKNVYFWGTSFYVINGNETIFLGDDIRHINEN